MTWTMSRGSGQLLVFTNETGADATEVEMHLRGDAMGGMFGRKDWSVSVPVMEDGQYVEAPFKAIWGSGDPPRMEISWTDPSHQRRECVIELPL
jgi:hypothetical protein